jgi:hypothetical protein
MERGGEYYDVRYIYFTYAYKKTLMLRVLLLLLFFGNYFRLIETCKIPSENGECKKKQTRTPIPLPRYEVLRNILSRLPACRTCLVHRS